VGSLAAIVFIAAAAAAGIFLGTQKTVIKGSVMAATIYENVKDKGISRVTCDDEIPVSQRGAVFECNAEGIDGSTARIQYVKDHAGKMSAKILASTGPKRR
jgi:hypothetical protein